MDSKFVCLSLPPVTENIETENTDRLYIEKLGHFTPFFYYNKPEYSKFEDLFYEIYHSLTIIEDTQFNIIKYDLIDKIQQLFNLLRTVCCVTMDIKVDLQFAVKFCNELIFDNKNSPVVFSFCRCLSCQLTIADAHGKIFGNL